MARVMHIFSFSKIDDGAESRNKFYCKPTCVTVIIYVNLHQLLRSVCCRLNPFIQPWLISQ